MPWQRESTLNRRVDQERPSRIRVGAARPSEADPSRGTTRRRFDTDIGWRSRRRLSTSQIRRRRRRRGPDVTAAPTTAAFATGAGPGLTALATTAVLATGWPMTPRRARRPALTGISVSFFDDVLVRLDRGDDRLDRNSTVGDQLTTRTTDSRCKRSRPQIFPDEYSSRGPGIHRRSEVSDVFLG